MLAHIRQTLCVSSGEDETSEVSDHGRPRKPHQPPHYEPPNGDQRPGHGPHKLANLIMTVLVAQAIRNAIRDRFARIIRN